MSRQTVPKDFLSMPAPPGYVAGLARGATGFTTRSDIGPAREAEEPEEGDEQEEENEATSKNHGNQQEDPMLGSVDIYDEEDEEADAIYAMVDDKMSERRKAAKERLRLKNEEKKKREREIQQHFVDLKPQLAGISEQEWNDLPEAANTRAIYKKVKRETKDTYTPVSDSILLSNRAQTTTTTLNTTAETPIPTDFASIGQARGQLLRVNLDQMASAVATDGNATSVDPKGYLTSLSTVQTLTESEIGDIKKAELLMNSVIQTNPNHAPGWIAAARMQEVAGKLGKARYLIAKGCKHCPTNEDVWIEAARLNTPENGKVILANAIGQLPHSVKIWLEAASLETEVNTKKRVLRRALQFIPTSLAIWKAAISLEQDPIDAILLLSRAIEIITTEPSLYLALAKLESHANAKKILNKAINACPTSYEIWIAAGRLEEEFGKSGDGDPSHIPKVDGIIALGISNLRKNGGGLDRERWLEVAGECENAQSIATAGAIVRAAVAMDIEEGDRKQTWREDAERALANNHIHTARAIYAYALKIMPSKKSLWRLAAQLEKNHATSEAYQNILATAVKFCPQAEVLWLMAAKEKWNNGDVPGARDVLQEAFRANPNSESIWLAAVKLESENGETARARILLANARQQAGTAKVWMKSAILERELGDYTLALEYLETALSQYPTFEKLYMIKAGIQEKIEDDRNVRETFAIGCKECRTCETLWILASRFEERRGQIIKARAILNTARKQNPHNALLWTEAVRLEIRAGEKGMVLSTLSRGLQECPDSGLLWTEEIYINARPQRRTKLVEALKRVNDNNTQVVLCASRLFWAERKLDKARSWFEKMIKGNPDYGDGWCFYYAFEKQHGNPEQVASVINRCELADPRHGERWQKYVKEGHSKAHSVRETLETLSKELPGSHEVPWSGLYP